MTSLQQSKPSQTAQAAARADIGSAWPTRSAEATAEHENARLERRGVAAQHSRWQERRSALIIGSVIAIGGLAWLLLTR